MRFALMIAATCTAAMLGTATAEAAPMVMAPVGAAPAPSMLQNAVQSGPAAKLILVRGGCGWGAHRTYRGYCHRNYGWRGRVRARHHWRRW